MTADQVQLLGGPMDGWLVQPDAAALEPDHWRDITEPPGRYERTGRTGADGYPTAEWRSEG